MLKRAATPQSFWPDGCPSSILLLSAWTNAFSGLDIQLQRVPTQKRAAHIVAAVQNGRFCLILSKNTFLNTTAILLLSALKMCKTNRMGLNTEYGSPMKHFFHQNPKLLGLGRQIGQINFAFVSLD